MVKYCKQRWCWGPKLLAGTKNDPYHWITIGCSGMARNIFTKFFHEIGILRIQLLVSLVGLLQGNRVIALHTISGSVPYTIADSTYQVHSEI